MIRNYLYGMPENINLKEKLSRPVPYRFGISMSVDGGNRFRSNLSSEPLFQLIDDAANGKRIHELLLINRPGDIWEYVLIKYNHCLDAQLINHMQRIRLDFNQTQLGKLNPWPDDCLLMSEFDALINWTDEIALHFYSAYIAKTWMNSVDDLSFSSQWLCNRYNILSQAYARMHFHHVLIAKAAMQYDASYAEKSKPSNALDYDVISTLSRQQVKAYSSFNALLKVNSDRKHH